MQLPTVDDSLNLINTPLSLDKGDIITNSLIPKKNPLTKLEANTTIL